MTHGSIILPVCIPQSIVGTKHETTVIFICKVFFFLGLKWGEHLWTRWKVLRRTETDCLRTCEWNDWIKWNLKKNQWESTLLKPNFNRNSRRQKTTNLKKTLWRSKVIFSPLILFFCPQSRFILHRLDTQGHVSSRPVRGDYHRADWRNELFMIYVQM